AAACGHRADRTISYCHLCCPCVKQFHTSMGKPRRSWILHRIFRASPFTSPLSNEAALGKHPPAGGSDATVATSHPVRNRITPTSAFQRKEPLLERRRSAQAEAKAALSLR